MRSSSYYLTKSLICLLCFIYKKFLGLFYIRRWACSTCKAKRIPAVVGGRCKDTFRTAHAQLWCVLKAQPKHTKLWCCVWDAGGSVYKIVWFKKEFDSSIFDWCW